MNLPQVHSESSSCVGRLFTSRFTSFVVIYNVDKLICVHVFQVYLRILLNTILLIVGDSCLQCIELLKNSDPIDVDLLVLDDDRCQRVRTEPKVGGGLGRYPVSTVPQVVKV